MHTHTCISGRVSRTHSARTLAAHVGDRRSKAQTATRLVSSAESTFAPRFVISLFLTSGRTHALQAHSLRLSSYLSLDGCIDSFSFARRSVCGRKGARIKASANHFPVESLLTARVGWQQLLAATSWRRRCSQREANRYIKASRVVLNKIGVHGEQRALID